MVSSRNNNKYSFFSSTQQRSATLLVVFFTTAFLWIPGSTDMLLLAHSFVYPQTFAMTRPLGCRSSSSSSTSSMGDKRNTFGHGNLSVGNHQESLLLFMMPEHTGISFTATVTDAVTTVATDTDADAITSTATTLFDTGSMIHTANSFSLLLSEDVDAMVDANAALQGVRIFFTVIAGLALAFVGLTYATVTFIIPKASEQLERDTKRLRPGLWEEYEARLGEGETMATRPDLLQELGNVMQPIIMEDFERSANAKANVRSNARKDTGNGNDRYNSNNNNNNNNQWKD